MPRNACNGSDSGSEWEAVGPAGFAYLQTPSRKGLLTAAKGDWWEPLDGKVGSPYVESEPAPDVGADYLDLAQASGVHRGRVG